MKKQQGLATLTISLFLLLAATLFTFYSVKQRLMQLQMATNHLRAKQAQMAAEAGLDFALARIDSDKTWSVSWNGSAVTHTLVDNSKYKVSYSQIVSGKPIYLITSQGTSFDQQGTKTLTRALVVYQGLKSGPEAAYLTNVAQDYQGGSMRFTPKENARVWDAVKRQWVEKFSAVLAKGSANSRGSVDVSIPAPDRNAFPAGAEGDAAWKKAWDFHTAAVADRINQSVSNNYVEKFPDIKDFFSRTNETATTMADVVTNIVKESVDTPGASVVLNDCSDSELAKLADYVNPKIDASAPENPGADEAAWTGVATTKVATRILINGNCTLTDTSLAALNGNGAKGLVLGSAEKPVRLLINGSFNSGALPVRTYGFIGLTNTSGTKLPVTSEHASAGYQYTDVGSLKAIGSMMVDREADAFFGWKGSLWAEYNQKVIDLIVQNPDENAVAGWIPGTWTDIAL